MRALFKRKMLSEFRAQCDFNSFNCTEEQTTKVSVEIVQFKDILEVAILLEGVGNVIFLKAPPISFQSVVTDVG